MSDAPPPQTPAVPSSPRLRALDIMRGGTVLAMILVNNPGTWSAVYPPLQHADWHGLSPTDLVFPFFLFMVGVAMAYAFRKYEESSPGVGGWWRIVRRTLTLILLGLALGSLGRVLDAALGGGAPDFSTLRFPGVLQRIGLAYFGASLVVLLTPRRWTPVVAFALLIVYTAALRFAPSDVPVAERLQPQSNVVRLIDRAVIGEQHLYTQGTTEPTDPEGILSTIPSISTVLIGVVVGRSLQGSSLSVRALGALAGVGVLLAVVGVAWGALPFTLGGVPINKKLWTPSFVLVTAGAAVVVLAATLAVFDRGGVRSRFLRFVGDGFAAVGINAITAYVIAGVVAITAGRLPVGTTNLKNAVYQRLFAAPLGDGPLASLLFAITAAGLCWALMLWFRRRGWVIRV